LTATLDIFNVKGSARRGNVVSPMGNERPQKLAEVKTNLKVIFVYLQVKKQL
jgi:hypothetical protein